MLDLIALRTFCCVGKLGGIGAAARELRISQPAVSQRLSKLEKSLGKVLRGRAGRRKVLTEEGGRLYEACRQAFDILDAVSAATKAAASPLTGTVRIATLSEISKTLLIPRIRAFRAANPSVEFELQYRQPYEMLSLLSHHEVDLAISNESYHRPQIKEQPLFKERIVCVGPRPVRRLSWRDISALPWLAYGADDPLWFEFERLAAKAGARLPRPALRVADVESVLRLAAQGAGYALAPAHSLQIRELKNLAVHGLPCRPISHPINLCQLRTVPLSLPAAEFLKFFLSGPRP